MKWKIVTKINVMNNKIVIGAMELFMNTCQIKSNQIKIIIVNTDRAFWSCTLFYRNWGYILMNICQFRSEQ